MSGSGSGGFLAWSVYGLRSSYQGDLSPRPMFGAVFGAYEEVRVVFLRTRYDPIKPIFS